MPGGAALVCAAAPLGGACACASEVGCRPPASRPHPIPIPPSSQCTLPAVLPPSMDATCNTLPPLSHPSSRKPPPPSPAPWPSASSYVFTPVAVQAGPAGCPSVAPAAVRRSSSRILAHLARRRRRRSAHPPCSAGGCVGDRSGCGRWGTGPPLFLKNPAGAAAAAPRLGCPAVRSPPESCLLGSNLGCERTLPTGRGGDRGALDFWGWTW